MPFQVSPNVNITEKDQTQVVPAASTSVGAFVGPFLWGPVNDITTIEKENKLVSTFGEPDSDTYQSFFSAANFLAYSQNLKVVRVVGASAVNATGSGSNNVLIEDKDDYDNTSFNGDENWIAKYPGTYGNSLKVSIADSGNYSTWEYSGDFDGTPGTSDYVSDRGGSNDELHVVVVDEDGTFTGTKGEILEKFAFVSKANNAKKTNGTTNYYVDVINDQSNYVWWTNHDTTVNSPNNWGSDSTTDFTALVDQSPVTNTYSLSGGVDDNSSSSITTSVLQSGWDLFNDPDNVDVSLLVTGPASATVSEYVIQNIAEVRLDCVAFVSPEEGDVVNNSGSEVTDIVDWRGNITSSSYGVADGNWKYQYDRYNDVFRWVPLNGDIAGLCARTDRTNDPWFSPGGYTRGLIKNVTKLAFAPSKANRDTLYRNQINPVIKSDGFGTVLLGDKTLLAKPTAFDRVNVRRLFIILEKSISNAAKFSLFEFNDVFTRAAFVNTVTPFLRDVQGRRGIFDFKVIADDTNNPASIVDSNRFVGDIYIKPARSINFIQLNFIAAPTGAEFSEIGG